MDSNDTQPCRICQKSSDSHDLQLISDKKLKSMIEIICGIDLNEESDVNFICKTCEKTIESSFKLRQLAQNVTKPKAKDTRIDDTSEEPLIEIYSKIEMEPEILSYQEESPPFDDISAKDDDVKYIDEPIELVEVDDDTFEISHKIVSVSSEITEIKCRLCLRMIKETYFEDHITKCNGVVPKHVCPFPKCNKRFVQQVSLKIHTASRHFNKKPFQCDFCQKLYASKDSLKGHMVSHRSERTEICFVCGAKFKSKLSLFKHKVIHENKTYRCSICNAKYKTKYDCNYHERVKHLGQIVQKKNPNPIFACDECDKVYKTNDSLKRHVIRIHRNVKDFVCWVEGCTARYGYHSTLKKHIRKIHPEVDLTGVRIVPDPLAKTTQVKNKKVVLVKNENSDDILGV